MFKKLLRKRGEGVLTGMTWMAVVAIVSGLISYAMWGPSGISGAASTSKSAITNEMTDVTGSTSGVGAKSITP